MNKTTLAVFTNVIALTSTGCAKVDSEDIRTSGFYAEISIVATDDTTNVQVRMRTGRALDADRIILSPGDQLSATMSGNIIALFNSRDSSAYRGSFNAANGSSEVKVALSRAEGIDAPNSTAVLPNRFEITAPDQGETFNAGGSITTVWSPAEPSNTMRVAYNVNCRVTGADGTPTGANFSRAFTVVDSGTHTTTINEVLNAFGSQDELVSGVSCPFEVTLTRINEGSLDSAFTNGGSIEATRSKSVLVNVVP